LQDYWFEIKHVPGKTHTATDFLSRPFIDNKGEQDNEDIVVLPPELFVKTAIQVFNINSIFGELDEAITNAQDQDLLLMKAWQREYSTTTVSTLCPPYGEIPGWRKEGRLVVPPSLSLKCKIMFHIHDTAGPKPPNRAKTIQQTLQSYWWPDAEKWVTRYIENCEQCHSGSSTIRATSPMTTSLQLKVHEAQERY